MANKIEDFGEKIGGAKKDKYFKSNGMKYEEYKNLEDNDKLVYMNKKYIFPKYDYDELYEKGLSNFDIMYLKKVYETIPNVTKDNESLKNNGWAYVKVCEAFKNNMDKFIEGSQEERDQAFKNNSLYFDSVADAGIYDKELKTWIKNDNYKSFAKVIGKPFKIVSQAAILETLYKEPFYETYADFKKRTLLMVEVTQDHEEFLKLKEAGLPCAEYNTRGVLSTKNTYMTGAGTAKVLRQPADEVKYVVVDKQLIATHVFASKEDAVAFIDEKVKDAMEFDAQPKEKQKVKSTIQRKKAFSPIVDATDRKGEEILYGLDISGEDYLETFKFRGGEFGNWLSDKDRQNTLNSGYEAFMDLANALNIRPEDVSLNNKLGIAFGARGNGNAAAHYEPLRNVINLTKNKGLGCLGHEWGHALDYYLGKEQTGKIGVSLTETTDVGDKFGMDEVKKAIKYRYEKSELPYKPDLNREADSFSNLIKYGIKYHSNIDSQSIAKNEELSSIIKQDILGQKGKFNNYFDKIELPATTKYLQEYYHADNPNEIIKNAIKETEGRCNIKEALLDTTETYSLVPSKYKLASAAMDKVYSKEGHGYWQSDIEMFARAFACYVSDKLADKGIESPYLNAVAYASTAVPVGEEKEHIFKAMDNMMNKCKEHGIFKENAIDYSIKLQKQIEEDYPNISDAEFEKIYDRCVESQKYELLSDDKDIER